MRIVALALLLQALTLCHSSPAVHAATGGRGPVQTAQDRDRVAVVPFLGPQAALVRAAVIEALVDGGTVELPPIDAVENQLSAGASVWAHAAELGQRLEVKAVVHGQTRRARKRWHLTITLLAGADGGELGQLHFAARSVRKLHSLLHAELSARIRPLLRRAPAAPGRRLGAPMAPPSEEVTEAESPGPPPEATPPPPPAPAITRPPTSKLRRLRPARSTPAQASIDLPPGPRGQGCPIVELELGGGVLLRAFDYRAEERGPLRGYFLRRAPLGQVEATLFPFGGSCGVAGAIGVRAGYGRMAPIDSMQADRRLSTTAFTYHVDLIGRISLGRWAIIPGVGYHARYYGVAEDAVVRVNQRAVGASLETRWRLQTLVLELGAEFRRLVDLGPLTREEWFPGATGMTGAVHARVGGAITDWLDLMVGVYLEYTSLDFHLPEEGNYPNGRAAGAYDGYLSGLISLRLHVPGTRAR